MECSIASSRIGSTEARGRLAPSVAGSAPCKLLAACSLPDLSAPTRLHASPIRRARQRPVSQVCQFQPRQRQGTPLQSRRLRHNIPGVWGVIAFALYLAARVRSRLRTHRRLPRSRQRRNTYRSRDLISFVQPGSGQRGHSVSTPGHIQPVASAESRRRSPLHFTQSASSLESVYTSRSSSTYSPTAIGPPRRSEIDTDQSAAYSPVPMAPGLAVAE